MNIYSLSPLSDRALEIFKKIDSKESPSPLSLLFRKMDLCPYNVVLFSEDKPESLSGDGKFDSDIVMRISQAWKSILGRGKFDMDVQSMAWEVIEEIGEAFPRDTGMSSRVRRFRDRRDSFFILLPGPEGDGNYGLPSFELLYLCNLSQIERDALVLHGAGVLHKGGLYLFLGKSGAGKSTVASLSADSGDIVLDEDQVVIYRSKEGYFTGDAWGYSLKRCNIPLQGLFNIVQDDTHYLLPLMQSKVAYSLFTRNQDVLMRILLKDNLIKVFHASASIAREIPGYELHFRKSPDFWKLIDEQIPTC